MRPGTVDKPKYNQPDRGHFLVAVDLGKTKVGVAVGWVPVAAEADLVWAGTVRAMRGAPPAAVADKVTWLVDKQIENASRALRVGVGVPVRWVCEWPMKYPDKRRYHADLEALHDVGHALARIHGVWAAKYRPGEWKGNVPKPAHQKRVARATGFDAPEEDHDTWDAVGIWAYALGITRRGGLL